MARAFVCGHEFGRIGNEQDEFSVGVGAKSERGNGFAAGRLGNQPQLQDAIAGGRGDSLSGQDDAELRMPFGFERGRLGVLRGESDFHGRWIGDDHGGTFGELELGFEFVALLQNRSGALVRVLDLPLHPL